MTNKRTIKTLAHHGFQFDEADAYTWELRRLASFVPDLIQGDAEHEVAATAKIWSGLIAEAVQKIDKLRAALAGLLRQTVSTISAIHPAVVNARVVAARAYQEMAHNRVRGINPSTKGSEKMTKFFSAVKFTSESDPTLVAVMVGFSDEGVVEAFTTALNYFAETSDIYGTFVYTGPLSTGEAFCQARGWDYEIAQDGKIEN